MLKQLALIVTSLSLVVMFALQTATASVIITKEDDSGITLEYRPELLGSVTDIDGSLLLQLKDTDIERIEGAPTVPVKIITVAVPPGSNPEVRLVELRSGEVFNGNLPIYKSSSLPSEYKDLSVGQTPDQGIGKFTRKIFSGFETIRIPVYPVQVNGSSNQINIANSVLIRVEYNAPRATQSSRPVKVNRLAEKVVINSDQASKWGHAHTANFGEANWPSTQLYRFEIDREGIFKVTFEDMQANGVRITDNGIPSTQLKLFGNGGTELSIDPGDLAPLGLKECPIYVSDGGDGIFSTGDWMLFYGRGAGGWVQDDERGWRYDIHHYTTKNVYWLSIDPPGGGKRMGNVSVNDAPEFTYNQGMVRYYLEDDNFIYYPGDVIGTGKMWYGHSFDGVSNFSYTFPVQSPSTEAEAAALRVNIHAIYPWNAKMDVAINGNLIGNFDPPIASSNKIGYSFDNIQDHLQEGTNVLTFNQLTPNNQAYFDYFEVDYISNLDGPRMFEQIGARSIASYTVSNLSDPWIFDVTYHDSVKVQRSTTITVENNPFSPARYIAITPNEFITTQLEFVEYLGPDMQDLESLWSARNQADIILITPDEYWDVLEPMLDYYNEIGLPQAHRVQLSEIYNRFSGGVKDISAIRNFLMYTAENWDKSPDYVVFCADGDYNYRNIDRTEKRNLVPPYENGRYGSDDWFVDFTPYSEDVISTPLPEMIIGRLTAQSASELDAMVDKIIAYALTPEFGTWRTRMTFVADDEIAETESYYETEHVVYNELIIQNTLPPAFEWDKVYLTEYAREYGREKPQATEHLLESINRGTLLVNYMGHGNPSLWAHENVFVQSRDNQLIENSAKLPLYIAFTCDWAYWDDPGNQSFPEELLARRNGGAISVVASTRLTGGGANYRLATNFFSNMLQNEDVSIGEALMLGKHAYRGANSATYHVLGDPAQHLAVPKLKGQFLSLTPSPLVPLQFSAVGGHVMDQNGTVMPDFNGVAEFKVIDTEIPKAYAFYRNNIANSYWDTLYYNLYGSYVYSGAFTIEGGAFDGNFIVPRDVTLGGDLGRVLTYYHNNEVDGFFVQDSVDYATYYSSTSDTEPPEISVYFDNRAYRTGDYVNSEPLLIVDVLDSSGVNLTGAMGHGVYARIDGRQPIDLTPYFSYNLDSYQNGSLERRIGPLEPGMHKIEIEAWDSFNNIAVKELDVEVIVQSGNLIVQNILNYPNPFKDNTRLTFQVTSPNFPVDYDIRIFTVGGRMIKDMRGTSSNSYINDIDWNGRDNAGRTIGNGVYLCKVTVTDANGSTADGIGKIIYAQ